MIILLIRERRLRGSPRRHSERHESRHRQDAPGIVPQKKHPPPNHICAGRDVPAHFGCCVENAARGASTIILRDGLSTPTMYVARIVVSGVA